MDTFFCGSYKISSEIATDLTKVYLQSQSSKDIEVEKVIDFHQKLTDYFYEVEMIGSGQKQK